MLHNTTTLSFTDGSAVDKAAILAENGGDVPSTGSKRTLHCAFTDKGRGEHASTSLFSQYGERRCATAIDYVPRTSMLKLIRAIEGASVHVFLRAFTYRLPGVRPVWWWWRSEQWNETF